ncbi:DNA repair protein [Lactobacillus sp. CBA3605]|uniref:JAB domain-containing protein n=1 Tax=Lactobacillus sp. CBA3605 TaxID=2099788 RepID=UPI000CFB3749|nr:JAB domain-containing protein [Lactobacillus sp. CBA3605]AVK60768.1 DNA repair protein [Lactobacillus sp. CBA3605]
MSLLTNRTDAQLTQIHALIQQFFNGFLAPAAAQRSTVAFETAYPAQKVDEWVLQPATEPLWQSLLVAIRCGQLLQQPSSRIKFGQVYGTQQLGAQLIQEFTGLDQEQLVLLCLNTKNQIIKQKIVFQGTLNACPVHPREIFRVALDSPTARIVIAHNHPSGDPEPSSKDTEFTQRLVASGNLLGVPVLDSFVVGATDYISFAERGLLNCNIGS